MKLPIIINVGTKPRPPLPNGEYARVSVRHGKCLRGGNTPYNELSQTDFGFADLPIIIDPHAYIRNKERGRGKQGERAKGDMVSLGFTRQPHLQGIIL